MPLTKVSTILEEADKNNTSAISFMCIDFNTIYSVITVAEELNTPVIIMLLPEHAEFYKTSGISGFAETVKELAKNVKVPIGLHLDHCNDYDYMIHAIQKGFTSIMADGSMYSLEKNIEFSKKVTETAHLFDVDVEGELGYIGTTDEEIDPKSSFTSAVDAARFCKETNIDALTISIGSSHGAYKKPPTLDIERLEEINAATNAPLVLHGGSGIPHEQLEVAFTKGINKFNVGTEFLEHYYNSIAKYVTENNISNAPLKILDMPVYLQNCLMDYLREKMKICHFDR